MTPNQFIAALRARWLLAIGLLASAVAVALALTGLLPRQYTAAAAVVIDIRSADPIAGTSSPALIAPSYMATQVDIMTSERVALRVVRDLKLAENPPMREQFQRDADGRGNFETWIARRLLRKVDVRPARESNLIELRYTAPEARLAAAVANAFAQAYLETQVALRVDPARRYSAFFDDRARKLREDLEKAQARLAQTQRAKGIFASDERLDVETARMNELSTQLIALQTTAADGRSRRIAAATNADALGEILAHPVIANLRTEISRAEAREQELRERLGDAHPSVIELRANVATLRSRIEQETRRLSASVNVNSILAESREAQVRQALEQQRARVLQLKNDRQEVSALQRDVENAQRAYDAVFGRLAQANLESQSEQTNATLLQAATEPSLPSFPRMVVMLPLGILAGLMLAAIGVLARETADRRIRTLDDLARELKLPVLGTLLPQREGEPTDSGGGLLRPVAEGRT